MTGYLVRASPPSPEGEFKKTQIFFDNLLNYEAFFPLSIVWRGGRG